jgi:DNA repair protein RecN (Recombination protein N)
MLQELRIRNFAIIDEMHLTFSRGLTVLTGETGAGKSIILNAVHLLLGDKATEELVRTSEEEASVEALFDISRNGPVKEKIKRRGEGEGDQLLIRRLISRSGRGRSFVNGNLATLGMLSEIGEELLNIYGQHEHQSLQKVETHIDILDAFGKLLVLRAEFQAQHDRFLSLFQEVQRIQEEREKRAKERDLMAFQAREIGAARIQIGEEETLKKERNVLIHAEKLMVFADSSGEMLQSGEGSAIERVQSILNQGREAAAADPSLSELLKGLEAALIQMEECGLALREYARRIEVNPARLEEVENRLEEISRLKRKYGPTEEEVLHFGKRVEEGLRTFDEDEGKLGEMEEELEPLRKEVMNSAGRLSRERRGAAVDLKKAVEKELASLGMKKTIFELRVGEVPLSPKGIDHVEFLISPNLGEEVKPLAKIASGGELSRIMLALKNILAQVGARQVLIFDEVDAGIGGGTAEVVGKKLRDLSKHHQVICVTHLAQIACFAEKHYSVRKETRAGRTVTSVNRLEKEAVVDEIARMLGGMKVTEKTKAHAREMLENAGRT